jgi:hypothetical protein
MSFESVRAITENLRRTLEAKGIRFQAAHGEDDHPTQASLLPAGLIFYSGESFEYVHGQRAGYAEAEYRVRVIFREKDAGGIAAERQKWGHTIREALTVDSLNTGVLAGARPVSRVVVANIKAGETKGLSALNCTVIVRYRLA